MWGAATSHFQIEGHPLEVGNRLSDWSAWTALEGKISDRTNADNACEFFHRYASDIEICRRLNLNAFRISLNWAVLCPEKSMPGQKAVLDPTGVQYYRQLLTSLKRDGIQTFVTLFHFALPVWLADSGGWTNAFSAEFFGQFAEAAASAFGDLVDYWVTLNEPLAYAYQGYVKAAWPPGHKNDYLSAFKAIKNMLAGHAVAYHKLHEKNADARVSFTMHWRPFVAKKRWNPLDRMVRYYRHCVFNLLFPAAVQSGRLQFPFPLDQPQEMQELKGEIPGLKGTMDYLAVNYYTRELSKFSFAWPIDLFGASDEPELAINCLGWETYPEGLFTALVNDLEPFKYNADGSVRPIYITENGFPTSFSAGLSEGDWSLADDLRIEYLTAHLLTVHRAINAGANVRGYLYWSLLDNFEWAEGLLPRFGLVRVAYPTQERTLRKSAHVYAAIARQNGIENAIL